MSPTWVELVFCLTAVAIIASALLIELRRYRRQRRFLREHSFGRRQRNNASTRRAILTRLHRDDRLRNNHTDRP